MPSKRRANGSAPTRGLRPWRPSLARRRSRVQWRLLALVTVVAVFATTLITTLTVLTAATEDAGVRGSFASLQAEETATSVWLYQPLLPLAEADVRVQQAVQDVVGDGFLLDQSMKAQSEQLPMARAGETPAVLYFGELDDSEAQTTLVNGDWPTDHLVDGRVPVAMPALGAKALGFTVGSTLAVGQPKSPLTPVVVVGLYSTKAPKSEYWANDPMLGAGHDPGFPFPGSAGYLLTDGVGPLLVTPGTMDAADIPVESARFTDTLDGSRATVDELIPLSARLLSAPSDVPVLLGGVAETVGYSSSLDSVVDRIATGLTITRSTVVVVSLLVLVLAIVTLNQASRLLSEARLGERHLMVARGASGRQLLGVAVIEAAVVAVVSAIASTLLAAGVFQLIAIGPTFADNGLATGQGLPLEAWLVSAAVSVFFVGVLVAPMLRRIGTLHEGEQSTARQERAGAVQRYGIDIAIAVLAGIAYWQLLTYRSPVSDGVSMSLDPLIVAGPVLALVGGALLAVRIVPLASRLAERIGARARGASVALASWEIARRPQRAAVAVLLLTLAIAISTFSQAYLATWAQSQLDQAKFAVGAPVRVYTDDLGRPAVVDDFPAGAIGSPQPVFRESALVDDIDAINRGTLSGVPATYVGLTAEARAMLDSGRTGEESGTAIATRIQSAPEATAVIELPGDTEGLSAVVGLSMEEPVAGVVARVSALLQDELGVVSSLTLGTFDVDGNDVKVEGVSGSALPEGTALVGFQAVLFIPNELDSIEGNPSSRSALMIKSLSALTAAPGDKHLVTPLTVDPDAEWRASSVGIGGSTQAGATTRAGWQLGTVFDLSPALQAEPLTVSVFGWKAQTSIPVAITRDLARELDVVTGDHLSLYVNNTPVLGDIVLITSALPAQGPTTTFNALGVESADAADATASVIMDATALSRAYVQRGVPGMPVTEWWLDVPAESAEAYVHEVEKDGRITAVSGEGFGRDLQNHPIRVATYGALQLAAIGAALLAALGFAIHATGSIRSRSVEFAQLRAIGLSRRRLVGVVGTESLLISVLGVVLGVGLGAALAVLVVPFIGVSADGTATVPEVEVIVPWTSVALLGVEAIAVVAAIVAVVAMLQRGVDPASVLRRGDER